MRERERERENGVGGNGERGIDGRERPGREKAEQDSPKVSRGREIVGEKKAI
jgi:hypothetical protein